MATKKKTTTKKPAAKKKSAPSLATRTKTAAKKGAAKKLPARKKTTKKKALTPGGAAPGAPAENPRAHALARKIGSLLSDKKALDIVILDVRGMTSYADYFVVASGESDRQVSAMAEHVLKNLKETENLRPIGHEGMDTGQWVLLDFGEVVSHLFFSEARSHYDLEGLWADAAREKVA
ncbi:ribosome-associated protein [Archangium gephyra]|uniref:Ribosomal silencing factor RsfS n=1 Tax=Archangium gephyra TaxID=48 RepID=A0AAC8Q4D2_9BACT|nr:ribosome silencing factor [Archangium gephyra]AKJ00873.1 Iojap protein [Archangium gephyra]REG26042.1 ribosome-associated protein [Archangium gephyra]